MRLVDPSILEGVWIRLSPTEPSVKYLIQELNYCIDLQKIGRTWDLEILESFQFSFNLSYQTLVLL